MENVVVSEEALREMVREALSNTGWSNEDAGTANVNPVVDPSKSVTDPVNPDFTPQTKTEFGIAVNQLVKNLPDTEMPELYTTIKTTLDQRTEKEEEEAMDKKALQGGSDEAINAAKAKKKNTVKAEDVVRRAVREALAELNPRFKAPITEAPMIDPADAQADQDPDEPEDAEGKPKATRNKAYKPGALGGMADVGGASFEAIAKETGMSVAGAKQAVDKALEKLKFLWNLPEDDRELLILNAMKDYVAMLSKTGELTAADVQLMMDHPDIVTELDGFREFLHNVVRKARKGISTFGEGVVSFEEAAEKLGLREGAKREALNESAAVVQQDNRGPYVIADGVEARPDNPNRTQYRAGSKVNVHRHGRKGVTIVEMPNGEQWVAGKKLNETNTAARVAAHKEQHPELYCPQKRCLWRTGGGKCPRHGGDAKKLDALSPLDRALSHHLHEPGEKV